MLDRRLWHQLRRGGHKVATTLWGRLPPRLRQWVFHAAVARLRPRLSEVSPDVLGDDKVPRIVAGPLSSPSGLGQSARLAAAALKAMGFPVYGIDLSPYFYEGAGAIAHGLPDGRGCAGTGHLLLVANGPYAPYALQILGRRFVDAKYVTGYWAWELPALPESWRPGFSAVHDIVVPSAFTASAVRSFAPNARIRTAPHPVALTLPLRDWHRSSGTFTVLSAVNVASGYTRKNPCALINAFRRAFGDSPSVQLKLLVTNADQYPAAQTEIRAAIGTTGNIHVAWQTLQQNELIDWWQTGDAYAALHRSEGFGLPLAESLCAGLPTVGTGWSGNMDFMTEANSHPIRFSLVDVHDPQFKYPSNLGRWAEPDVEHAAAELSHILANRAEAAHKAIAGAAAIRLQLSGDAFVRALLGRDASQDRTDVD